MTWETLKTKRLNKGASAFVRFVLSHPEVAPYFWDDGTGIDDLDVELALSLDRHIFLSPVFDGKKGGIFWFHPWNNTTLQCHAMMLPDFRGRAAMDAGRSATDWIWDNTEYTKLVARIPTCNRHGSIYCLTLGFNVEGCIRECYQKNGDIYDETILGLLKKEDQNG